MLPIDEHHGGRNRSRSGIALLGFLAIVLFLLTTEHRAHVMGLLPFLFLLACPLLHMFHHSGGHGAHTDRDARAETSQHGHDARGGGR